MLPEFGITSSLLTKVCTPIDANSEPILIRDGVIERFLNSASLAVTELLSFLQATNDEVAMIANKKKLLFLLYIILIFAKVFVLYYLSVK